MHGNIDAISYPLHVLLRTSLCVCRLLNMVLDPEEIRTQDVASTIQWVAENPLGRDLAFQFFVDNFEDVKGL